MREGERRGVREAEVWGSEGRGNGKRGGEIRKGEGEEE
jgi:hypothetical protein